MDGMDGSKGGIGRGGIGFMHCTEFGAGEMRGYYNG